MSAKAYVRYTVEYKKLRQMYCMCAVSINTYVVADMDNVTHATYHTCMHSMSTMHLL